MMNRKEALEKYEKAKMEGKVDLDIISLLDRINSSPFFYTTSSCSGRIVLFQITEIGDKKDAEFLGKWHREVNIDELENAIGKYERDYLFMLMQSPIIHIVAGNLDKAKEFMKIALECGFKYTCIKAISNKSVLLEVLTTENLHIPLGEEGKLIVDMDDLRLFLKIANMLLRRSKKKLKCLENKINYLLHASF